MDKPMKVIINADTPTLDVIKKGLRLVRVYQGQEASWITPVDADNAKELSKMIDDQSAEYHRANRTKKEVPVMPAVKCDPDTNCDW